MSLLYFLCFSLRLYAGDVEALGWWDLFINYGYITHSLFLYSSNNHPLCCIQTIAVSLVLSVAECFAFLICTKWYNPAIHRRSNLARASSSSTSIRYLHWSNSVLESPEEDHNEGRMCSLQDIGGHIMKIPFIGFQVMLFMYLEVC